MKPRINLNLHSGDRARNIGRSYRPTAQDLRSDSGLSRGELSLFVVLTGAVLMAFAEHARVAHRFVEQMPEFAHGLATLVRNLV
jgi:hypothetical protein